MSNCNTTIPKVYTDEELSRRGEFRGPEKGMTSWRDLGGRRLPCDRSLRILLMRYSTAEIDHVEDLRKYFREMGGAFTAKDGENIFCDLVDDKCPAGLDLVDAVEYVARLARNGRAPMETDAFSNTLVRAGTEEVGVVLVSFNSFCSAAGCPSPYFIDGQVPIELPGSQGVQWRHAIIGEKTQPGPLMKYQRDCEPCEEEFSDEEEPFVNVFYRDPMHITMGDDRKVYPCTTDADSSSGAASPDSDSIPCSDQDDSASGTDYGCDSDSRDLSPPVNISFANMSLGGGPLSTSGPAQRTGPHSRSIIRFSRRSG